MIKDYHGWTVEKALQDVDLIIGQVRNQGKSELYEFITGHGAIKPSLMVHLQEYGLISSTKLGNSGVVCVVIE